MDRTMKYMGAGQCPDDMMPPPAEVPIGWQRRLHQGGVVYISPSGSVLACLEQAKSYLLTDGTCKCGLECPLILHKVFNFDPGAVVRQRTAEDVRADADVTKLCIHKRKIIAVATLHKSMESQRPAAAAATGGGHGGSHAGSLNHQAIRNEMHNGLSNSVTPDGNSSYKMTMSGQQQHYQHDLGSPPQRDLYAAAAAAQSRSRLGAAARRSPFSGRHGSLLSPPSSASRGSQHCGDGTPSPRPDSLRSPDLSVLAFHRALSPGSGHVNGERFTPLSPPGIMVHGSPSGTQPPCALTARSSVSLSPSLHTKSPGRRKSPCNFNTQIVDYQLKASSVCHAQQQQQQHPPLSQLPSCVIQKKQVTTSEKDPLGILDPIPSKSHVLDQIAAPPSHLQFNAQPHVPSVNVNIPPAIVPLPSNLPLPTVKPGTVGHGLRLQHANPSSVSPSPITSPVHLAHGPALARAEEASQHSHASVSFAQHGSALAAGLQVSRLHSRSPRPSVPLHHLKEPAVHLRGGVSRNLDSMRPPPGPPGSDGVGQNSLSSRGVASRQQLLNQQNPSFPASSLLSAAAKAQLVNQNKLTNDSVPGGAEGLGPPGLMGGGEQQMYMEGGGGGGYGGISAPGPTARSEGQSGRAALRDKLMSQQREAALRKRKHPDEAGALAGGGGDGPFNMSAQRVGAGSNPSSSRYPEPMKRMMQQGGAGGGGLQSSTPMAHLLQSMSHQSAQNGLSHTGHHHHHHHGAVRSGKSPFFEESVPPPPPMSTLQQSGVAPPPPQRPSHQLHHGRVEVPAGFQDLSNKRTLNPGAPPPPPLPPPPLSMDQFTDPLSQMYEPGFGGGSAGAAAAGYGGGHNKAMMGPMDGLNPQRQQQHQLGPYSKPFQGNPPFRERVVSNGGFHTFSESGDACSLSSSLRHHRAQEERVLSLVKASQRQQQQQQQMSGQGETTTSSSSLQSRGSQPACGSHPDMVSSNHHPMDRLLHNFQVGFPERALHPPGTSSFGRPDEMSHPGIPPGFRDGQWEYSAIHGGLRNGREVTDAGQWAEAAGMSKETMPCVIMTPNSNDNGSDAFIASAAEMMPKKLCHSVIHGPLRPYCEESAPPRPRARSGRPRKKPERPNNGVSSGAAAPATPVRLRSPRRCNPKKQWLKDASSEVPPDHDPWQQGGGDPRLLQSPAGLGPPDLNGDGYAEMLRRRGFLSLHQGCPPAAAAPPPHFNGIDSNGLFAHVNGGGGGDGVHSRNARQSAVPPPPPPSLGSEGRGAGFVAGDYVGHYNGHLNGQLNGSYNNGQCKVNLGAVADMADKKLLQYKPRSQHARELLWAQALSLHSWPSRLKDEGPAFLPAASHGAQGKAEPERFHKTIKDDLESLHRANIIHQNGGDFNNYLEAAIENAMSELNKLTGNRDGQMDGPKSKRRRIPR